MCGCGEGDPLSSGRYAGGWFWPAVLGILICDQALKVWAEQVLQLGTSLAVVPGLFSLTRVHNTGVAFGMAQGNNLLTGMLAAGILVFAAWLAKGWDWERRFVQVVAAMVAGGALGNLIDRVRLGYVLDFFDFHFRGWSWPAFNIADACISAGVGLLVLSWLAGKSPEKRLDKD
ncbi:MAG: signal peptidase II [Verrucomicrobia bacterium]|nr:signal peptidase II [Verrucomicrobiota bacterium]NDA25901.1 signal peptidase II [Verrucomicrobiota bacterium]NDD56763.1 signal peptidase II [Verrucomicrobiota bacterium]